jgi:DNA-directed RNA polymerase I and III subunit RPAC2
MAPISKSRSDAPAEAGDDATMQDAPPSHQPTADDAEEAEVAEGGDEEMNEYEEYGQEDDVQRVRLVGFRPHAQEEAKELPC